jgi:hypothetical protein
MTYRFQGERPIHLDGHRLRAGRLPREINQKTLPVGRRLESIEHRRAGGALVSRTGNSAFAAPITAATPA